MKNLHKKIMLFIFFLIIGLVPLLSLLTMPREQFAFSENENRYLTRFPQFSAANVESTSFMKGFDDWANDRVIGRESFIRLKNRTDRLLGKTEIGGVFITDERMMQVWSGFDEALAGANLTAVNDFAVRHSGVPVYFMLAPTSQEIYRDTLPNSAPIGSQRDFIRYCYDTLGDVNTVDVLPILEENANRYIYYRTDHHWTSLGAYIGYTAAISAMGFTPWSLSNFDVENASNSFLGTLYSKTLDRGITPDTISIYTLSDGDPEVHVTINSGVETEYRNSLYFREFLGVKDKYSVFLGTNAPIIEVESHLRAIERSLLVFKDSYAHSLIPFLAKNYSHITVADMRYINTGYDALFDVDEYDAVLFVYNVITFSEDTNLVKLNAGR